MVESVETNHVLWGQTYSAVEKFAIEALESLSANDSENSQSATEIIRKVKELNNNFEIPDNTFRQSLSELVKDKSSRITKLEGRNGYFLTTFSELIDVNIDEPIAVKQGDVADSTQKTVAQDEDKVSKREFLLYPILEQWLSDQNYKVGTAIYNKRSNETWGSPDIAGIRVEEHLSRFEIEIVTIEAKASKDQWGNNWRKDIFEAISHKRYANRVYFCIAVKLGDKIQDISDMKYYCELYRIGLLLIELNPVLFKKFEEKDIPSTGFTEDDKELIFISEKFPAPFNVVPLKFQRDFCENTLEITSMTGLFNFAKDIGSN